MRHSFSLRFTARAAVVALAAAAVLGVAGAGSAGAGSKYERERYLRDELQRLPVAHGVAHAKLQAAAAEARRLDGAAIWLDRKIHERDAWLRVATRRASTLRTKEQAEERRLSAALTKLTTAQGQIVEEALRGYATGPAPTGVVEALLKVEEPELSIATVVVGMVVEATESPVDEPLETLRDVRARHHALHAHREVADAERDRIAASREELVARRNSVGQLRWKAHQVASERKRTVEAIRYQASMLGAELRWLEEAPASLQNELEAHHGRQPKRKARRGTMTSPLPGVRMNSNFGPRIHPITGTARWHTGVDLPAPTGTPIRAAAGGRVFSATVRGGYGTTIVIDHGKATATVYAHMSGVAVDAGDKVKRGQVIGYVGSTGFSTGPHLHFEVRQHGRPDNPLNWL